MLIDNSSVREILDAITEIMLENQNLFFWLDRDFINLLFKASRVLKVLGI